MIRTMRLMFSSRPYREVAPPDHMFSGKPAGEYIGPLEALPVPDDELEDEYEGGIVPAPDRGFTGIGPSGVMPGGPMAGAGPLPAGSLPPLNPPAPAYSPTKANVSLPPVQAH